MMSGKSVKGVLRELWKHVRGHEPFIVTDYDVVINFPYIDESDVEEESDDFKMLNPNLIDFNVVSNLDSSHIFVPSADSWKSILTTWKVLSSVLSNEWCSKAYLQFHHDIYSKFCPLRKEDFGTNIGIWKTLFMMRF